MLWVYLGSAGEFWRSILRSTRHLLGSIHDLQEILLGSIHVLHVNVLGNYMRSTNEFSGECFCRSLFRSMFHRCVFVFRGGYQRSALLILGFIQDLNVISLVYPRFAGERWYFTAFCRSFLGRVSKNNHHLCNKQTIKNIKTIRNVLI